MSGVPRTARAASGVRITARTAHRKCLHPSPRAAPGCRWDAAGDPGPGDRDAGRIPRSRWHGRLRARDRPAGADIRGLRPYRHRSATAPCNRRAQTTGFTGPMPWPGEARCGLSPPRQIGFQGRFRFEPRGAWSASHPAGGRNVLPGGVTEAMFGRRCRRLRGGTDRAAARHSGHPARGASPA